MGAATLFVHDVSIFRALRKIILGVIKKWSSAAALNLNFIWMTDISGWLCSLQLLSVTLPVMEIKPRLFYRGGKKSRSTPAFKYCLIAILLSTKYFLIKSNI